MHPPTAMRVISAYFLAGMRMTAVQPAAARLSSRQRSENSRLRGLAKSLMGKSPPYTQ